MPKKAVKKSQKAVNEKSIRNLKPFPKGKSGNPKGREKLPEEVKEARQLLKEANERVVSKLIATGKYEELLELGINTTVMAGKVDGLKFINDYLGNKPQDKVELTAEINYTKKLTDEEIEKELEKRGLPSKLFDE